MNLSEWLKEPVPVDCITTVMLKILDGKCKMLPEEKLLMADLYDQIKHLNVTLLPADIHQLILQAREGMDEKMVEIIYEQRLYAEQAITRPTMKAFKARLREEDVL